MSERVLADEIDALRDDMQRRHEQNERRFDRIESTAATMAGEVKVIIALLVANGGLNLAALFMHH